MVAITGLLAAQAYDNPSGDGMEQPHRSMDVPPRSVRRRSLRLVLFAPDLVTKPFRIHLVLDMYGICCDILGLGLRT